MAKQINLVSANGTDKVNLNVSGDLTVDGASYKESLFKVKQKSTTNGGNYPVLLRGTSAANTDTTDEVSFATGVYVNPSTSTITANFSGDLDGNATSANSAITAEKATNDGNGNEISATYETKNSVAQQIQSAKSELSTEITNKTKNFLTTSAASSTYYSKSAGEGLESSLNNLASTVTTFFNAADVSDQAVKTLAAIQDYIESDADAGSVMAQDIANLKAQKASTAVATTKSSGLMSAADKEKLNGIQEGANNYTLPVASTALGGVKTDSTVASTSGYTAVPIIDGIPYYKNDNTKNTAGATTSTSKLYLIGATSVSSNPRTYVGGGSTATAPYIQNGLLHASTITANSIEANVTGNLEGLASSATKASTATYASTAATANKLGTNAGGANQPIYFANGVPVECAYTVNKSVPSDAKFTDTTYTLESFGIATDATHLNYTIDVTSNIQTQLDNKAASSHSHSSSDIIDIDNYLSKTGGTMTGSMGFVNGNTAQKDQPTLKWKTISSNTPYIGFATDQTDGTFLLGSLRGTNYASGLAIGGGSTNLLWKGEKVVVASDTIDKASSATKASTATYSTNAGTANYAKSANEANSAINATSASTAAYATKAGTATYATNAGSASYATDANNSNYATSAGTATYATNSGTATYATNAGTSSYGTKSGTATYATKAATATRLANTASIGTSTKPVYFNASGQPVACSYTIQTSVPANAVFTDTDTKNTVGAGTSSSQLYLVGVASTGTNPQSYVSSSTAVYVNGSTVGAGYFAGLAQKASSATKASSASRLVTARSIQTDLSSSTTASFNGTANVTPGVTGVLPVGFGGTGSTTAAGALTNLGLQVTTYEDGTLKVTDPSTASNARARNITCQTTALTAGSSSLASGRIQFTYV